MSNARFTPEFYKVNGITLTVTQPGDPAMELLQDPNIFSVKKAGVLHDDSCYICLDPEFAQMGMPLCYPCEACTANPDVPHSGHVPADDTLCTVCGSDAYEAWMQSQEGS